MKSLHQFALSLPDVEEGISCKGTSLESPTATVNGKAFLFLGTKQIRFKLGESLKDADKASAKSPDAITVGANGWVTIAATSLDVVPPNVLKKWIEESYRLMAPKKAPLAKVRKSKK
jgi:hypothetical protein